MVVERVLGLMPDYCTYESITLDNFIGATTTDQIVLEVMIFFGLAPPVGKPGFANELGILSM